MTASAPNFERVIETYHDEIYRYIWRMLNGASRSDAANEAHDLAQEVFMRAYRAYPRLRPGSNIRAWLYKIATNCVYSAFEQDRRKWARDIPLIDERDDVSDDVALQPDIRFLVDESMEMVRRAIDELPPKQRAGLLMRYIQELDYPEIAEALGCSEDSARANVYQAIKRLRAALAESV
jgi:RNA polymerase sigma-70 factor (ECF subfamily)